MPRPTSYPRFLRFFRPWMSTLWGRWFWSLWRASTSSEGGPNDEGLPRLGRQGYAEHCRDCMCSLTMNISIGSATAGHLDAIREWLKDESDAGLGGFFCNWPTIDNVVRRGDGICAMHEGVPIGFVLLKHYGDGSISIVEVHPSYRRQGIARQLMVAAEEHLRKLGAKCIHVECTSEYGEALCRALGYVEPEPSRWGSTCSGNATVLRKYLSTRHPKPRSGQD